jgi:hypothetical protein
MEFLAERGARWAFEEEKHEAWKSGYGWNRLYDWKIIPMGDGADAYVLVHVNPGRIINDPGPMFSLHEAIRSSCCLNLMNTRFTARGLDEPDLGVRSFCIAFFKTHHWQDLSEMFLADLDKDFHRRIS